MMERDLIIQWGTTPFVLASIVAVAAFSLWALLQALRPVEPKRQTLSGYDVVKHARQIASQRWRKEVRE